MTKYSTIRDDLRQLQIDVISNAVVSEMTLKGLVHWSKVLRSALLWCNEGVSEHSLALKPAVIAQMHLCYDRVNEIIREYDEKENPMYVFDRIQIVGMSGELMLAYEAEDEYQQSIGSDEPGFVTDELRLRIARLAEA